MTKKIFSGTYYILIMMTWVTKICNNQVEIFVMMYINWIFSIVLKIVKSKFLSLYVTLKCSKIKHKYVNKYIMYSLLWPNSHYINLRIGFRQWSNETMTYLMNWVNPGKGVLIFILLYINIPMIISGSQNVTDL